MIDNYVVIDIFVVIDIYVEIDIRDEIDIICVANDIWVGNDNICNYKTNNTAKLSIPTHSRSFIIPAVSTNNLAKDDKICEDSRWPSLSHRLDGDWSQSR